MEVARGQGARRRPARDRPHRRRGGGRARRRLRRRRDAARGARRPAGRRRAWRPGIISTGGRAARPYGFKTRARRRAHHLRRLALPRRAQPDRDVPRRGQGRARRPRPASRRSPSGSPRSSRPGRRPSGRRSSRSRRSTGTACSRWRRSTGSAGSRRRRASSSTRLRCRRRTPPSSSAGRAMAPDDVTALLLVGLIRSGVHVGRVAPALAVLGAAAVAGGARTARPRTSSSTTRTASCSTRRSRARTASSRRSSSRPYSKYIARWAAHLGMTPNQVTLISVAVGVLAAAGVRDRRAPGHGGGRGAPLLRLRARLRRRPARPLHAPVLQARRLAGLDLRPHEGVRRVRRARDRREPDRRSRVAARGRGADAADRAPRGRLLLSRLAAPGDRRRAAAADRGPVRRAPPGLADHAAGRRGGGGLAARAAAADHGRARDRDGSAWAGCGGPPTACRRCAGSRR